MKKSEPKILDLCKSCEHELEDCENVELETTKHSKYKLLTIRCKKYSKK